VSYSGQLDLSVTQPRLGHERQLRRTLEPIPAPRDIKHVPFIIIIIKANYRKVNRRLRSERKRKKSLPFTSQLL
jgi:hypothetical protein